MIKTPTSGDYKLDVILKNGIDYLDKQPTPKPMGDNEKYISFWDDDKTIMIIPLTEVVNIKLKFE